MEAGTGLPVRDAVVSIHTIADSSLATVKSSADGTFHFDGLEPVVYRMLFEHPAYAPASIEAMATPVVHDTLIVPLDLRPIALDSLRVTSSVQPIGARIDPDVIPASAAQTLTSVLTGQSAGVNVTRTSGQAGAAGQIRIRGARSLQAGTPLVFVDGVRIGSANIPAPTGTAQVLNFLDGIATSDVEMIEVLRGPDAVTRYGSSARDGVILITTRRAGRIRR